MYGIKCRIMLISKHRLSVSKNNKKLNKMNEGVY